MCELKCCANCKYWYCYSNDDKFDFTSDGECRRFPPSTPVFESSGNDSVNLSDAFLCMIRGTVMMNFPFTYAEDWCGEFDWADKLRISDDDDYEDWEKSQED